MDLATDLPLSSCPYCGTRLDIIIKSLEARLDIPRVPPTGAKDLKLYNTIHKVYCRKYGICPKCEAKYYFNNIPIYSYYQTISDIPSDETFIEDFLNEELPQYPSNVRYHILNMATESAPELLPTLAAPAPPPSNRLKVFHRITGKSLATFLAAILPAFRRKVW